MRLIEIFFLIFLTTTYAQAQSIENPSSGGVKIKIPRLDPDSEHQRIMNRKQSREESTDESSPPRPEVSEKVFEQKQKEELKNEAIKDRPMEFMLQATVGLAHASVSKQRKKYLLDPTVMLEWVKRPLPENKSDSTHLVYGARIASFSGTGIYKKVPARFSFLYFGPMIGVAKFDERFQDRGSQDSNDESGAKRSMIRRGYIASAGLALQSRFIQRGEGEPEVSPDFSDKGIGFDVPGLWLQFQQINIHHGSLQWGPNIGALFGQGKIFAHVGISFGGWH